MNAGWMLASTLVAMLLAGAAGAFARVASLYRGVSLRWVWTLATLTSLAVALLWLRPAVSPDAALGSRALELTSRTNGPGVSAAREGSVAAAPFAPTVHLSAVELPSVPRVLERVLFMAWLCASGALALVLVVAAARLRAEQAQWTWTDVTNTRVLVSKTFGPAIVGVFRPAIVLPGWVLTLDEPAQRAIVAHEVEHRAARDPALLLAGLVAVVLMPWNIGLWMSWRGLRRAIELDCDARVLARGIDGAEYARVLLSAWKSAHGSWLPSTAFAERASGLGARVEHLMRPEPRRRAMRSTVGTLVAAALVFVACMTPSPQRPMSNAIAPYPLVIVDGVQRPDLPPLFRFAGTVKAETTTTPTYRITYGPKVMDTVARKLYPSMDDGTMMQTIDAPASVVHFGDAARYGALLFYTKKYRDAGGAIIAPTEGNMAVRAADPATPVAEMAGRAYANIFNGITLDPDRSVRARAIIENEMAQQRVLAGPGLVIWPRRIALNAARDAELRALLTSESDRAKFDVRSLEGRPRGTVTIELIEESTYNNLFRDSTYSVDVKSRARAIIRTSINEDLALYARAPNAWNESYDPRLAIRTRRDADLRSLLSTDAQRASFDRWATRLREGELKRP